MFLLHVSAPSCKSQPQRIVTDTGVPQMGGHKLPQSLQELGTQTSDQQSLLGASHLALNDIRTQIFSQKLMLFVQFFFLKFSFRSAEYSLEQSMLNLSLIHSPTPPSLFPSSWDPC